MSKLDQLQAKNIKGLKSLSIDFKEHGNLIVLGGDNGAGKSSSLDSVIYLFGGKGVIPEDVLRHGEEKGIIDGVLDDGTHVKRTFTKNGVHLVVENSDGMRFTSPQTVLAKLIQSANGGKSALLFDPLSFVNMKPKERIETLKEVLGIDTTAIDEAYGAAYEERRNLNRDLKQLQARLDGMETFDGVPSKEISVSALVEELRAREETNRSNAQKRDAVAVLRNNVKEQQKLVANTESAIEQLKQQLAAKENELVAQKESLSNMISQGTAAAKEADALIDADTDVIKQQIEDAGSINDKIKANVAASNIEKEITACKEKIERVVNELAELTAKKKSLIENAKFAIPGLALNEEDVTVDGVRFENLASGDQTEISVAMALAMQPELKVVLIHSGSLLDSKHLESIARMAEESDTTILMEVVGSGPEVDILLENGQMVERLPGEHPAQGDGLFVESAKEGE